MRKRLAAAVLPLLLALGFEAGAESAALEIATPCRAHEPRLAGVGGVALLLWQEGGGAAGDAKKGCRGETRAAWIEGGAARPLAPDFLGAGFRAAGSEARATELDGKLLVVWSEKGAIEAAIFEAGAETPEKRFQVTPEDAPSAVAAPRPLAASGNAFTVFYASDFFSGRRRNAVRRDFKAAGSPAGDPAPAFPDFIAIELPLAARTTTGFTATGGPGLGPLGEGFFLQFWDQEGEALGEPVAVGEKAKVLGGALVAAGETYVFTWNIRAGKGQEKALLRLYGSDGQPKGPARELGPTVGTPALDASGGKAVLAFLDPATNHIKLAVDLASEKASEPTEGPATAAGATGLAIDATRRLLAWAEENSLVVAPLPP